MIRLTLLLALTLAALTACTPVAYMKPGMTAAERDRDLEDCVEIARRQAFRDAPFAGVGFGAGFRTGGRYGYGGRYGAPSYYGPSRADLELRYQRVCMNARGYTLEPVENDG